MIQRRHRAKKKAREKKKAELKRGQRKITKKGK